MKWILRILWKGVENNVLRGICGNAIILQTTWQQNIGRPLYIMGPVTPAKSFRVLELIVHCHRTFLIQRINSQLTITVPFHLKASEKIMYVDSTRFVVKRCRLWGNAIMGPFNHKSTTMPTDSSPGGSVRVGRLDTYHQCEKVKGNTWQSFLCEFSRLRLRSSALQVRVWRACGPAVQCKVIICTDGRCMDYFIRSPAGQPFVTAISAGGGRDHDTGPRLHNSLPRRHVSAG